MGNCESFCVFCWLKKESNLYKLYLKIQDFLAQLKPCIWIVLAVEHLKVFKTDINEVIKGFWSLILNYVNEYILYSNECWGGLFERHIYFLVSFQVTLLNLALQRLVSSVRKEKEKENKRAHIWATGQDEIGVNGVGQPWPSVSSGLFGWNVCVSLLCVWVHLCVLVCVFGLKVTSFIP